VKPGQKGNVTHPGHRSSSRHIGEEPPPGWA
jgi:hypothetical protein